MHQTTRQSASRRRAFTLVEAVAAIVILGILGSLTSQLVFRSSQTYFEAATRAQLQADLTAAMDRIDKEIRQIAIKTAYESIAPNIDSVTASSIAWQDEGTQRSLSFSGSALSLYEQAAGSTSTLMSSVAGMQVQAFDESGGAMAASLSGTGCDSIRRISVTLTATRSGMTETLRTKVFLRSTMQGASP